MDPCFHSFVDDSLRKLTEINSTQVKVAQHWRKLQGLFEQQKYVEQLNKRVEDDQILLEHKAAKKIQTWWRKISNDRIHMNLMVMSDNREETSNFQGEKKRLNCGEFSKEVLGDESAHWLVNSEKEENFDVTDLDKAATKIQAWWRGVLYRRSGMLPEHKKQLQLCLQGIRDEPCSEANPREERNEPLNRRIQRYLDGLLSDALTERKVMALRLCRLADRSHVAKECMLNKGSLDTILGCLDELNRSDAHLYIIRPLCSLLANLLEHLPFVEPFARSGLDKLVSASVHLIYNNYRDRSVVVDLVRSLELLSTYDRFMDKLVAVRFDWFMPKYKQRFAKLKTIDPARYSAYCRLCRIEKRMKQMVRQ